MIKTPPLGYQICYNKKSKIFGIVELEIKPKDVDLLTLEEAQELYSKIPIKLQKKEVRNEMQPKYRRVRKDPEIDNVIFD